MRILLIDNYDSYTWNLMHLVWRIVGVKPELYKNDERSADYLLNADFTHIIISPGPGAPSVASDFGVCGDLLRKAEVPCLGVCLGHQGLAWTFGGTVTAAPEIMHGRLSSITHDNTGIFAGIPQGFKAVRYHSLSVAEPIPAELRITARSESSVIMGLAHRTRPLFGVQFHPESVETLHGGQLMKNFLTMGSNSLSLKGSRVNSDYAPLVADVKEAEPEKADLCSALHVEPLGLDFDTATLFQRVFAKETYAFWLDSARSAYGMGKFSFLGSASTLVRYFAKRGIVEEVCDHATTTTSETIFDYLRRELGKIHPPAHSAFPFHGGFVGYLGYGVKGVNGIGRFSNSVTADAEFLRVDRYVVFDHESGLNFLVTVGLTEAASTQWCSEVRSLAGVEATPLSSDADASIVSALDFNTFEDHFDEVQRWLRRGDSYQACYTYQLRVRSSNSPLAVYLRLRKANPAPYSAYFQLNGRYILSSSPERFVQVDSDGWAEAKPIKGTCPRFSDPQVDEVARRELQQEEKTRSENLMIVDLLRNDLGKVCDVGTITVPSLMSVESYATLHQLVTTVRGKLLRGVSGLDCVQSMFPGGSMTGAPKKRSVELLDGLEPEDRGIYSGCIGYFSYCGQVDQSIVIRTIVWDKNSVSIGVGGALTIMSESKSEYEETRLKARALLAALGATNHSGQ